MQNEIRSLTALRGIAALWVVAYHYSHHTELTFGKSFVKQGDLAVDIFFTLSGFILVYVYRGGFDTVDFLVKRFARLYPVHVVTLLAVMAMVLIGRAAGVQVDGGVRPDDVITHILLLHSSGVNDGLALNYPSWSISAESFAYIAFPMLLIAVMEYRLKIVIPLAITTFIVCAFFADITGRPLTARTYDFSLIRIFPEFVLGMLAARLCLERRISSRFCFAAAALLTMVGIGIEERLIVVLAAPFLISALFFTKLQTPWALRYLGMISYSLYMVHALVEKAVFTMLEMVLGDPVLPSWTLIFAIVIAVMAASVLYHFIEEPGRRLVMYLNRRIRLLALKIGAAR